MCYDDDWILIVFFIIFFLFLNYRISFKPAEGQYDLLVSGATYDRDNGRFEINPVSPVAVEGQPTELVCSSAGGSPDPVLRYD